MFSRVSFLFALALALTLARPVAAQQTVDVGSISGRVVDEMGMTIAGVAIVATQRLDQRRLDRDHRRRWTIPVAVSAHRRLRV